MRLGHEVGSLLSVTKPLSAGEAAAWAAAEAVQDWFDSLWRSATPLSAIDAQYKVRFESSEHLRAPTPTDDDAADTEATRASRRTRGLSAEQLRQLRAASSFWIEAGLLHENRGRGRPGNQLMLSRMTRVFFGFTAVEVPRDTYIGRVAIEYGNVLRDDCSLRFSNNHMDVLTLPLPGSEGPASYDGEVLLFERQSTLRYRLSVLSTAAARDARRKSKDANAEFKMSSGRAFGVF